MMLTNSKNASAARTVHHTNKPSNLMHKAIVWILLALTVGGLCLSHLMPLPATKEQIEGDWIGLPHDRNDFCRLVLRKNGSLFARVFVQEEPMIYAIQSYEVDQQSRVTFRISAASTNAYPIRISGNAAPHEIRIVISSPDGGWSHESVLYREETVERMLRELREAMEQFEGKRKGIIKASPSIDTK